MNHYLSRMPNFTFNEKKHEYTLDGVEMTGVTSVLGVVGDTGGLQQWYANLAAADAFLNGPIPGFKEKMEELVAKDPLKKLSTPVAKELDALFPVWKTARTKANKTAHQAAKIGTEAHKLCEEYELGSREMSGTEEAIRRATAYTKWFEQNIEKTLFVEKPLFSKEHFIGGTPDGGFLTKDGKYLINDKKFKGSLFDNKPFWQQAEYRKMLEEMSQDTETHIRLEWESGEVEEYANPQEYLKSLGAVTWDGCVAILVKEDGTVEPHYRYAHEEDLKVFESALYIYRKL